MPDTGRSPRPAVRAPWGALVALLCTALALTAPAPARAQPRDPFACPVGRGSRISIEERDAQRTLVVADPSRCFVARSRGDVAFTDDDADVAALAPGGWLVLEESRDGVFRRAEWVERDGGVARRLTVNGVRADVDGTAAWVGPLVAQVARESTIGAPARAARLLARRGPAGLLEEARLVTSDAVRDVYLRAYLDAPGAPRDLRPLAALVGRTVGSDSRKAELLQAVLARGGRDASLLAAVTDAAGTIGSDSQRAATLAAVLASPGATDATRADVAAAAERIGSDRVKGELLAALAPTATRDARSRAAWLRTAGTLGSDRERARTLLSVLDTRGGDGLLDDAAARTDLFAVLDGIGSDAERGRVLRAIARRDALPRAARLAALRAATRLGSDREKADVLLAVAAPRDALADDEVRRAFLAAARGIASSGEYRRVMDAVVR